MDFDLSKPEQYAAWFLRWFDEVTTPILRRDDGSVAVRVQVNEPQIEQTRIAALTVVESHLGNCIRQMNGNLGKDETPKA